MDRSKGLKTTISGRHLLHCNSTNSKTTIWLLVTDVVSAVVIVHRAHFPVLTGGGRPSSIPASLPVPSLSSVEP